MPMPQALGHFDVIVNATLQDTERPMTFADTADLSELRRGSMIIDVSCDEGMGFDFAKPTSFEDPTFSLDRRIVYYAVDHSPTYLWDSATWEISEALLPYLEAVMRGPDAWSGNPTLANAIEIRDGVVRNQKILSFQRRSKDYPHEIL